MGHMLLLLPATGVHLLQSLFCSCTCLYTRGSLLVAGWFVLAVAPMLAHHLGIDGGSLHVGCTIFVVPLVAQASRPGSCATAVAWVVAFPPFPPFPPFPSFAVSVLRPSFFSHQHKRRTRWNAATEPWMARVCF